MEISKAKIEGLKVYLIKISKGLITDVDFFVSYLSVFPKLNIMVDVTWELLPSDRAYNYNLYLEEKFSVKIKQYLTMVGIPFNGMIEFDIMNWPE